ncbi:putative uncharacterized protein C5orf58 homolog isoform X1 [Cygnus olor]|uniref:putative uncharacterized protein C5orf58 homolog isoform X1 n=2 Tax=Cygnus olor TaxID=8869 RepID=UPI001ADE5286|nr:putative uncharacterized protein C5orf58 homolog isoform X1 [Cygnus olor]
MGTAACTQQGAAGNAPGITASHGCSEHPACPAMHGEEGMAQPGHVLKQLSSDVIQRHFPECFLMSRERRAERMGEEKVQGFGSLAQTDDLHSKPLSEGKRDESKESMSNVFRNDAADQQFNLEAAVKNVDRMSNELKKLNVESQLLLCDLILNFNHPMKAKDLREDEEKTWSLTD